MIPAPESLINTVTSRLVPLPSPGCSALTETVSALAQSCPLQKYKLALVQSVCLAFGCSEQKASPREHFASPEPCCLPRLLSVRGSDLPAPCCTCARLWQDLCCRHPGGTLCWALCPCEQLWGRTERSSSATTQLCSHSRAATGPSNPGCGKSSPMGSRAWDWHFCWMERLRISIAGLLQQTGLLHGSGNAGLHDFA